MLALWAWVGIFALGALVFGALLYDAVLLEHARVERTHRKPPANLAEQTADAAERSVSQMVIRAHILKLACCLFFLTAALVTLTPVLAGLFVPGMIAGGVSLLANGLLTFVYRRLVAYLALEESQERAAHPTDSLKE